MISFCYRSLQEITTYKLYLIFTIPQSCLQQASSSEHAPFVRKRTFSPTGKSTPDKGSLDICLC